MKIQKINILGGIIIIKATIITVIEEVKMSNTYFLEIMPLLKIKPIPK